MEKKQISFELTIFNSLDEMQPEDANLVLESKKAMANAYSPYSNFCVGAALLLESGKIILGNNQENASFPAGVCAERVALFLCWGQLSRGRNKGHCHNSFSP